jgi:hypothetical protein
MTKDQKKQYIGRVSTRYCSNLIKINKTNYNQAVKETEDAFNSLFQKEYQNFIFNVIKSESDIIGNVWFGFHPKQKIGYITDLEITQEFQNKGFDMDVLILIEKILNEQSVNNISTYVFNNQELFKDFLLKSGYETASIEQSGSIFQKKI